MLPDLICFDLFYSDLIGWLYCLHSIERMDFLLKLRKGMHIAPYFLCHFSSCYLNIIDLSLSKFFYFSLLFN